MHLNRQAPIWHINTRRHEQKGNILQTFEVYFPEWNKWLFEAWIEQVHVIVQTLCRQQYRILFSDHIECRVVWWLTDRFWSLVLRAWTWWRHQTETFSALLTLCAGNSPGTGEFPAQRPVTRSFDVSFDLRLSKRLSKQSWGWWSEGPSSPLWRPCYESTAWPSD